MITGIKTDSLPLHTEVGGKAYNLTKMMQVFNSLNIDTFNTFPISKIGLLTGLVPRASGITIRIFRSFRQPEAARDHWHKNWTLYRTHIAEVESNDLPFNRYIEVMTADLVRFIFWETLPLFSSAKIAGVLAQRLFRQPTRRVKELIAMLDQSLDGNVTVEMGHELFNLHQYLGGVNITTPEQLKTVIESKTLPPEFLTHWQQFLETYGHRGQKEIDIASPKVSRGPGFVFTTTLQLSADGPDHFKKPMRPKCRTSGEGPQRKTSETRRNRPSNYKISKSIINTELAI